jgi:mycothiol synthase
MTSPGTVRRVGESSPALDRGIHRAVAESTHADGASPLDEAASLALRRGLADTTMWCVGEDEDVQGFAWRHGHSLDLVVRPDARGHGVGRQLAEAATADSGPLTAWSHGNHPGAAALATTYGFERVRDLWVLRRPLHDLPELFEPPSGVTIRTFRVGGDEDAWVALNAEAFAHHPEQGSTTRSDLDERIAEPWFDPAGFFVAERDGRMVGFHWTKVHREEEPAYGEVYVVGVSPPAQGGGLGRLLTLTGLHHLAGLGLEQVLLYVESDNGPAVAVYERLGFTHAAEDTHVQYSRRAV